jgi:transposase
MVEYFVGVDVSKGYADFAILDQDQRQREAVFRLDDTRKGHDRLREILESLATESVSMAIYVGVESTGGLENNWLECIRQLSATLPLHRARLNPSGVAQYVRGSLTRTVTDAVSAVKIAEYLVTHRRHIRFDEQQGALHDLRPLWTTLTMLKKQHVQLTNNLHHMLYGALPSILIHCRRGFPQWVIRVVSRYPSARRLAAARIQSLSTIAFVTEERARKLVAAARSDVASQMHDAAETVIKTLAEQVIHLDASIDALQKELTMKGQVDPRVALLCSFKGIGTVSAVGLLMNMPDLEAIPDVSHLASYWGVHPVFKDSGDGHMIAHMSKCGRSQPRAILFMVTFAAICHNPLIKSLYRRLVYRKKMKKMAAIGVCMHKITRIIYGMLKTNTSFNPDIDRANRNISVAVTTEQLAKKEDARKRRYQQGDEMAPISNREKKRREKINGSQRTDSAKNGITASSSLKHKNVLVSV